ALPGVRGVRRADRPAQPRLARARLEPPAGHPAEERPRLRRLAGAVPARRLWRGRGRAEQERVPLLVADAAPGGRAGVVASVVDPDPPRSAPLARRVLAADRSAVRLDSRAPRARRRRRDGPRTGGREPEGRERALQRLTDDRRRHRLAGRERERGLGARRVSGDLGGAATSGAPGRAE